VKDRSEKILTILILLIPLLFVLRGGYLQQVTGYVYLFLIQGYVAWFLYFKSGQPFFGYSVTMAIGAYGTIVLTTYIEGFLLPAMLISAVAAAVVGVLVFVATSRARGFYVSMASFLLAILFPKLIEAMQDFTGGRSGLYFSGLSGIIGYTNLYLLVIFMTAVIVGFFFWFMGTKTGKILTLISENDQLTQAVGINTYTYKLLAYAVAGFVSGIGGALYVNYTGFVSSVDIEVFTTVYIFFIPLIGGSRVFYGPVLGALFVILVPELLVPVERYMRIFFGLIFILVIVLLPQGLAPNVQRLLAGFVDRRAARRGAGAAAVDRRSTGKKNETEGSGEE
jgi:branched-chain amino acid transport system permease protein